GHGAAQLIRDPRREYLGISAVFLPLYKALHVIAVQLRAATRVQVRAVIEDLHAAAQDIVRGRVIIAPDVKTWGVLTRLIPADKVDTRASGTRSSHIRLAQVIHKELRNRRNALRRNLIPGERRAAGERIVDPAQTGEIALFHRNRRHYEGPRGPLAKAQLLE